MPLTQQINDATLFLSENPIYVGVGALVLIAITAIFYWYIKKKEAVRSEAIQLHDTIRTLKRNLRKAKESYDSRTQWEFQDDGSHSSMGVLQQHLEDLQDRSDDELYDLNKKRSDEIEEIEDILTTWGQEGPDYYSKDEFRQDVKHINDIIERW